MVRIALVLVALAVWIYAIIDCVRADHSIIPGRLKKGHWVALTVFVPLLGSVIWLVVAFQARHPEGLGELSFGASPSASPATSGSTHRRGESWSASWRSMQTRSRKKSTAPDDDPSFLKHLEAQRRFEEWDRQRKNTADVSDEGTTREIGELDAAEASATHEADADTSDGRDGGANSSHSPDEFEQQQEREG